MFVVVVVIIIVVAAAAQLPVFVVVLIQYVIRTTGKKLTTNRITQCKFHVVIVDAVVFVVVVVADEFVDLVQLFRYRCYPSRL